MTKRDAPAPAMSRRRTVGVVLAVWAAATAVMVGAILPAEFGVDPTGVGRLTGLDRLWSPPERAAEIASDGAARSRSDERALQSHVIEFELDPMISRSARFELEYKVRMRRDDTIVFDWESFGTEEPEDLYSDFHGHTLAGPDKAPVTVATYRQQSAQRSAGFLTAPFDGVHGWYFQNSAVGKIRLKIRITGFYELIPPGEVGNEAKISAVAAGP